MSALFQSRELADTATEKIRVFAQPQRLMILSYLLGGERGVAEIEKATGIGQPTLSQQLAELRRADLVVTRREAKLVYYRLASDSVMLCVRTLEAMFGRDEIVGLTEEQPQPSQRAVKAETPAVEPSTGAAAFARII
ncbi:ArsR/SmtB family transcription factor [Hyphomicrobium facile]|uniref:DNA-binding transcriptional regulator, ArsR family n=1 Tax=Hyphomicrobium facile TaxID=51670 RepID=A0A1I7MUT9_9HYPH|nr:metalloregulator ArsR/SmtB family transcription factor [Hyphomicrobium facile]SFV26173.1 DNA-binding transcriptional regulator, ArsR family [Hyphomicrobium facile]